MAGTDITKIFFVDDSDDELFISRLSFTQDSIEVELEHFFDLDAYFRTLDHCTIGELKSSITVLDLNLTVGRGTDGVKRVRAQPHLSSLIIGICSGSDDPADRQDAHDAGGNFFISKPLNLLALESISEAVDDLYTEERDGKRYLVRTLPS